MPNFKTEEEVSHYKKVIQPLETLVEMTNIRHDNSFSITINVKGTMISGVLVSLKEYHEHNSDQLVIGSEDQTHPEAVRRMTDLLKEKRDMYEIPGIDYLVNSYVCIKDPTFIFGSYVNSFQLNGQYWIGKIESVDGFMIGEIKGRETPHGVESGY